MRITNTENAFLSEIGFEALMDREIVTKGPKDKLHYLSPGGYSIIKEGKEIPFDFVCSYGHADGKRIAFNSYSLDTGCYEESVNIKKADIRNAVFNEFFLFTGEGSDPEINLKEIISVKFWFSDGDEIVLSKKQIEQINTLIS